MQLKILHILHFLYWLLICFALTEEELNIGIKSKICPEIVQDKMKLKILHILHFQYRPLICYALIEEKFSKKLSKTKCNLKFCLPCISFTGIDGGRIEHEIKLRGFPKIVQDKMQLKNMHILHFLNCLLTCFALTKEKLI